MLASRALEGRRTWLAVAIAGVVAVAGCGGNAKPGSTAKAPGTAGSTFTVRVSNQGAGGGAITSTPAGIACPADATCSADFAYGTTVVLGAGTTPLYFNGWFGDCNGRAACTLTGNADKYVVAFFSDKPQSHPNVTDPKLHGPAFIAGTITCTDCHGASYQGAGIIPSCNDCHTRAGHPNWRTDCTLCHGDPTRTPLSIAAAPPRDTKGNSASTAPGVGAHERHLTGGPFRGAVACTECHAVPIDMGHALEPLDLTWGPLASAGGISPSFDPVALTCTNYCHGAANPGGTLRTPTWTQGPSAVACGGCHALPPPTTSGHPAVGSNLTACHFCHPSVKADATIDVAANTHINGRKDVTVSGEIGCATCHGQPPTTGSHLVHAFGCNSCHAATTADGTTITNQALHMNEVADVSPGNGAAFTYAFVAGGSSTCSNISCHFGGSATWGATGSGHVATLDSGDIVVFADGNTDHGAGFSITESCTLCHYPNLKTQHAGRCDLCHQGANPVASLAGGWTKGCSQAACHPSVHTVSTGADHFRIWQNSSAACDRCHDGIGGFPGSGDNCSRCHDPSLTAAAVGDHQAPTTTSNAASTYVGSGSIQLTATDPGTSGVSVTWYSLDGKEWVLGNDVGFSAPTSGSRNHTLQFYSVDHALNVEATRTVSFTVQASDTTPPTTTCSAVSGTTYTGSQTFTLSASDAGSGVASTWYKLDAGAFTSGTSISVAAPASGTVSHTIQWYSIDVATNQETTKSVTFNVQAPVTDGTPPTTTSSFNPAAGALFKANQPVTLSATDAGSGVKATYYRIDSGSFTQGTSFTVTEGQHTFGWYSVDNANNTETAHVSNTFRVDTIAPVTSSSAVNGTTYTGNQTFTLSPTDAGSGVASTWYKLDGASVFTSGTSVAVAAPASGTVSHTIQWYSIDVATNQEATKSVTFNVAAAAGPPPTVTLSFRTNASFGGWSYVLWEVHDAGGNVVNDVNGNPCTWWNDDPGHPSSMWIDYVVPAGVAYTMYGAWGPMPDGPDSDTGTNAVSASAAAPGATITWWWY